MKGEDIEKEKKIEENCSSEKLLLTKKVDESGTDFSKDLNSTEAAEICEELKYVQPKSSSVDLKVDAANVLYNDGEFVLDFNYFVVKLIYMWNVRFYNFI